MTTERTRTILEDLERTVLQFMRKHKITHDEYRYATDILVATVKAGEGSLLYDVFFEAEATDIGNISRQGSVEAIEGPFYLPNASGFMCAATISLSFGRSFSPTFGASEEPRLSSKRETTQRPFRRIVRQADPAVTEEAREGRPAFRPAPSGSINIDRRSTAWTMFMETETSFVLARRWKPISRRRNRIIARGTRPRRRCD